MYKAYRAVVLDELFLFHLALHLASISFILTMYVVPRHLSPVFAELRPPQQQNIRICHSVIL